MGKLLDLHLSLPPSSHTPCCHQAGELKGYGPENPCKMEVIGAPFNVPSFSRVLILGHPLPLGTVRTAMRGSSVCRDTRNRINRRGH